MYQYASQHDDAIFAARKFGHDVTHFDLAGRRIGNEVVILHLVILQPGVEILADFFLPGAAIPARTEGDDVFYVFESAFESI